jgi:hypothetical protein
MRLWVKRSLFLKFKYKIKEQRVQSTIKPFFILAKLGIGHDEDEMFSNANWLEIKNLSDRQGLSAIVLNGINILKLRGVTLTGLSQQTLLEWIGEVMQNYEARYEQYEKTIAEMAGFYASHDQKMMVLKGYACSLNWPKPNSRPCGDIDIWQFGEYKKADELITKEKGIKVNNTHHHHTVFSWGDFTVENHYDFNHVHHHKSGAVLEKIFKELGKDDNHYVILNGEKVYIPSPNLHALFLLKHSMTDFAAFYVTLRQVLDWGFYVQKHHDEIEWEWLDGVIKQFHMKDFFDCINAICVQELGFHASIFPYVQYNPSLKDKVLEDILNPRFTRESPNGLISRLLYKYRRWKGNAWKHEMCYNESMCSAFWSGVWNHLLKPSSI